MRLATIGNKVATQVVVLTASAVAIPGSAMKRDQGMAFVCKFTENVKAQGLVDMAIARSGLRAVTTAT